MGKVGITIDKVDFLFYLQIKYGLAYQERKLKKQQQKS
jgi:hypothetical protein